MCVGGGGGVRLNYLWFLGVGWWVIAFSLYFDGGVKESFENGSQPPPPPKWISAPLTCILLLITTFIPKISNTR